VPLFERPPLETLAQAKDRWTPIYLEHGRLEVDDSSVIWIGADGLLCRIPVATVRRTVLLFHEWHRTIPTRVGMVGTPVGVKTGVRYG
jgi:hypothetical protein